MRTKTGGSHGVVVLVDPPLAHAHTPTLHPATNLATHQHERVGSFVRFLGQVGAVGLVAHQAHKVEEGQAVRINHAAQHARLGGRHHLVLRRSTRCRQHQHTQAAQPRGGPRDDVVDAFGRLAFGGR